MKTRNALLLLYALSFLIVSVGSGSAQIVQTPFELVLTFDSTFITSDINQTGVVTSDTVRGTIQNTSGSGVSSSFDFTINMDNARQWIIITKIDTGANGFIQIKNGDVITIAPNQTLPVKVIILPYPDGPDTEHYCLSLTYGTTILSDKCITLAITNTKSAVSTGLLTPNVILEPNPAGDYMFVRGLDNTQTGYRYEIFSITGVDVRHGLLAADARINLQALPSGAYRLLVFDAKRTIANSAVTILH
jgi:hypothetical protein